MSTRRRPQNVEDYERQMDALFASFDSTHEWVRTRPAPDAPIGDRRQTVEASHA